MTIQDQIDGFKAIIQKLHQIADLPRLDYRGFMSSLNSSSDFSKLYIDVDSQGEIDYLTYSMVDNWGDEESFEVKMNELEQPIEYFEQKFQAEILKYQEDEKAKAEKKVADDLAHKCKEYEKLKAELGL